MARYGATLLSQAAQLAAYAAALANYRARDFAAALAGFAAAPQDSATQLYRERCARHLASPPALDWDGVETLNEK